LTNRPFRITAYQVSRGTDAAIAADIAADVRHGNLEGVNVDFRHLDLPDGWWARPFWYVWGRSPHSAGLIFPSEAEHTVDELRKAKGDLEADAIFARAGDSLTVGRVEVVNEAAFMCHPHDAKAYDAYLTLARSNGDVLNELGPLRFYGSTRIKGGAMREAFDNAMSRIGELRDTWGLSAFDPVPRWSDGTDAVAHWHGSRAHQSYSNLLDGIDRSDGHMTANLRSLANSAMLAGYALAVHEMRKAENTAAKIAANLERGTPARTDKNREIYSKQIWAEKPYLSRNAVAKIMMERWPDLFGNKDVSSISKSIKPFLPEKKA
jgi:hypothetical protein